MTSQTCCFVFFFSILLFLFFLTPISSDRGQVSDPRKKGQGRRRVVYTQVFPFSAASLALGSHTKTQRAFLQLPDGSK